MGATMTNVHLPEDIGDVPSKSGAKPKNQSYSIVMASDRAVPSYKVEVPNGSSEVVPLNFSDTYQDLLGLQRKIKTTLLFRSVSRYDLEQTQWDFTTADSSTGVTDTESIIWTGRINARATYPGSTPSVRYSVTDSAARIQCLPFSPSSGSGLQQALLFSKRVFAPSMGAPIFITIAVKMSLSLFPNVKKQWGWFNGNSGYFFQIKADGSGDNFAIVRRSNFGGITEEEIPRSSFNGDKLTSLNFTNITMFGVEVGVGCGYNARFWAFILGKWILVHSINSGTGTSQNPSINEAALPIAFSISNTSNTGTTETLFRYGTSVSSLGETTQDNVPNEVSTTKTITTITNSTWVLMGIRGKKDINNVQNANTLLPLSMQIFSNNNLINVFLLKNPESDSDLRWSSVNNSGVEFNTSRIYPFRGGQRLITASVPASEGATINLSDLFSLQRNFGSNIYANDIQLPTDTGYQPIVQQDNYWVCATFLGSTPSRLSSNAIVWDLAASQNISLVNNPTISRINVSLSFIEV
jgi:hypothetical protein